MFKRMTYRYNLSIAGPLWGWHCYLRGSGSWCWKRLQEARREHRWRMDLHFPGSFEGSGHRQVEWRQSHWLANMDWQQVGRLHRWVDVKVLKGLARRKRQWFKGWILESIPGMNNWMDASTSMIDLFWNWMWAWGISPSWKTEQHGMAMTDVWKCVCTLLKSSERQMKDDRKEVVGAWSNWEEWHIVLCGTRWLEQQLRWQKETPRCLESATKGSELFPRWAKTLA